ncbi:MAG: porin [Planctomycetaceae bacterium]|jgi:hypothetical protein|nr:porin [Planctomycetaceae bacterium]
MRSSLKVFILGTLFGLWMTVPVQAQFYPQYNNVPGGGGPIQGQYVQTSAVYDDPMAAPCSQPFMSPYGPSNGEIPLGYPPCQQQSCFGDCGLLPYDMKHCGPWFLCGWLDQSYTRNGFGSDTADNGTLKFNDMNNEYMLNQLYLSVGRSVKTSGCNFDLGGKIDVLYGTDYLYASALGLETHTTYGAYYANDPVWANNKWNSNKGSRIPATNDKADYGLAMPQFYLEMNAPVAYGLNVKAGHFYSPMGYESVMSPQNFFYSHSYSMMYGEPITYTGVLLTQNLNSRLAAVFGVTRGWDKFEDPNDKLTYLAGFRWKSCDERTNISFVVGTGNESLGTTNAAPVSQSDAVRTHYSLVLSRQLTDRLKYVFQHDLGYDGETRDYQSGSFKGHWYSLNQYVFYQLTETLEMGVRAEWFRDYNNSRIVVGDPRVLGGDDYSEVTLGLNWKPCPWLNIRPETRWDWSGLGDWSGLAVFDDGQSKRQFTAGLSTLITF